MREAPITVLSARPGGACHHVALLTEEVAVTTIAQSQDRRVIGGVDTHKDVHVAAVIDDLGRIQRTQSFPATRHGYRRLLGWLQSHGEIIAVGVEGRGSWGAGLARYLAGHGVSVVEVNRPNRQDRRLNGKSDPVDADAAARAVLSGRANTTPKSATGPLEALRQLRGARNGAIRRGWRPATSCTVFVTPPQTASGASCMAWASGRRSASVNDGGPAQR